jgi:hypothetical protein
MASSATALANPGARAIAPALRREGASPALARRELALAAPRRLRRGSAGAPAVCASLGGGGAAASLADALVVGTWCAAAAMGARALVQNFATAQREANGMECETCGGSGQEPCIVCTRWSDAGTDSAGCSACAGSRRTACHSCRGGGTKVPITAKLYIKPEAEYFSER